MHTDAVWYIMQRKKQVCKPHPVVPIEPDENAWHGKPKIPDSVLLLHSRTIFWACHRCWCFLTGHMAAQFSIMPPPHWVETGSSQF
jgi:hypothetical protein